LPFTRLALFKHLSYALFWPDPEKLSPYLNTPDPSLSWTLPVTLRTISK